MNYSKSLLRVLVLAWAFALLPCMVACAEQANVLKLSPFAIPLKQAGVPQLHEKISEATGAKAEEGLGLWPDSAYEWTRISSDSQRITINASVNLNRFDHAVLTVWNWHNRAVAKKLVSSDKQLALAFQLTARGVYVLTLDGFKDDKPVQRLIRSIGVTEDLNVKRKQWKSERFFLGVCAFPGRYHWKSNGQPTLPADISEQEARKLEAGLMGRLGFQVVRTDVSMEMGRKADSIGESYRFNFKRMDAAVAAFTSQGFKLALQLMNAPDWAIADQYAQVKSNRWRYPHQEQAQRAYIGALLKRYGKHANFVQIFNEPDQVEFWAGTNEEFRDQYLFSHSTIREKMKDVPIVNGGYAFIDESKVAFFANALKGHVDMQAYHSHGNLRELKKDFGRMEQVHEKAGYDAPTYLNTETGYAAWRLDQERRQAQAVAQKSLYCWANKHRGVLLFCSRMTRGPGRTGRDFGFLDYNFCPRFAYGTIAALVSTLSNATYRSTHVESDSTHIYEFSRGKDTIIAGFTTGLPTSVQVSSNATSATHIDEMGNASQQMKEKQFNFILDGYPRYLILTDAGQVAIQRVP